MVKLLDCTLRDGGYYTDWDFSPELVRELLDGLNAAGVDVIELGYRSRNSDGFFGLFKTCNEELVADLLPEGGARYAFMIDAKEFLDGDEPAIGDLRDVVPPSDESIFSMCRIAAHPASIEPARGLVEFLVDCGYAVTLNVMGVSALGDDALADALHRAAKLPLDVLYLADSFGSLTPAQAGSMVDFARSAYDGALGVHMHENQGLALANSLAAIDHGVDFVDGTVTGMGRGAGNVRLEQLLLTLYYRDGRDDLEPTAILPSIQNHLRPLQQEHGWGWDVSYMISGLVGIHPTYCQELRAGSRYEMDEVVAILEDIPPSNRAKYSEAELLAAQGRYGERKSAVDGELRLDEGDPVTATCDTVLVLARGAEVHMHAEAIRRFVETHSPLVIECNDTGITSGLDRITVVLNAVRMHELAAHGEHDERRVIATGLHAVPSELKRERTIRVPYALSPHQFSADDPLTVPAYVAGMIAFGLAVRAEPTIIYLAGFDGFDEAHRAEQAEMEDFWRVCRQSQGENAPRIVSLLRTKYDLPIESVYGLI